jgi:hypothetical protein
VKDTVLLRPDDCSRSEFKGTGFWGDEPLAKGLMGCPSVWVSKGVSRFSVVVVRGLLGLEEVVRPGAGASPCLSPLLLLPLLLWKALPPRASRRLSGDPLTGGGSEGLLRFA